MKYNLLCENSLKKNLKEYFYKTVYIFLYFCKSGGKSDYIINNLFDLFLFFLNVYTSIYKHL